MLVPALRPLRQAFVITAALYVLVLTAGCAISPQVHVIKDFSSPRADEARILSPAPSADVSLPPQGEAASFSEDVPAGMAWFPLNQVEGSDGVHEEEAPAASPAVALNPLAMAALERALEQIGVSYRRGGAGPGGFDCSGLVRFAFAQVGVELPHGASLQQQVVEPVDVKELQPGDLVFFRIRGRHIDHVGIYLDGSEFVHAPSSGKRVSIADLENAYWKKRLAGAGRISENL